MSTNWITKNENFLSWAELNYSISPWTEYLRSINSASGMSCYQRSMWPTVYLFLAVHPTQLLFQWDHNHKLDQLMNDLWVCLSLWLYTAKTVHVVSCNTLSCYKSIMLAFNRFCAATLGDPEAYWVPPNPLTGGGWIPYPLMLGGWIQPIILTFFS